MSSVHIQFTRAFTGTARQGLSAVDSSKNAGRHRKPGQLPAKTVVAAQGDSRILARRAAEVSAVNLNRPSP
jgi:hypothetical protein